MILLHIFANIVTMLFVGLPTYVLHSLYYGRASHYADLSLL